MRTRAAFAGVLLLATTVLAGCADTGRDASAIVSRQQAQEYQQTVESQEKVAKANASLPTRPAGVVDLDGATNGSLSALEARRFEARNNVTSVNVGQSGEDKAFDELCKGEIDLVDSVRTISRAEWDACRAVGLDVVQFQVASEAIVIALKSESDIGTDCLAVDDVTNMFRAGSPVVNWGQLGFDNVKMEVAGPDPDNNAFGFFGRYVLDSPQPSLTNLRSDYNSFGSDQEIREFLVGDHRQAVQAERFGSWSKIRAGVRQVLTSAKERLADAREEVDAALAERAKGIRDNRPVKDKARDQRRVDDAYAELIAAKDAMPAVQERWRKVDAKYQATREARKGVDALDGNVAFMRYSYYELFQEQLRAFEVAPNGGERNCIFPSQLTITSGEYPFSRHLLLTTTTKAMERQEVSEFLKFYLKNAQREAERQRLVPLPENALLIQQQWLTGETAPVLVSPDTSDDPSEPATTGAPAR